MDTRIKDFYEYLPKDTDTILAMFPDFDDVYKEYLAQMNNLDVKYSKIIELYRTYIIRKLESRIKELDNEIETCNSVVREQKILYHQGGIHELHQFYFLLSTESDDYKTHLVKSLKEEK